MLIDMNVPSPNVDGILIQTGFLFPPSPLESIIPGTGPVFRETILIGGTVGTSTSITGTVDDQEI